MGNVGLLRDIRGVVDVDPVELGGEIFMTINELGVVLRADSWTSAVH
jgi:hypothetical protein